MNRKTWILSGAVVIALSAVAAGAWWIGMQQGMAMMNTPAAASNAAADPSQWTIPQGEAATRRHIRDGLKAGDVDPATGRRILNYHDPMVPGKNFDAPGRSPFMEMMLVPRYAGSDGTDTGSVSISPRIQQNLGLRTAPVEEGSLTTEVTAVGNVAWNERDQVVVSSRAMGFVEKLHVRALLDRVTAGAPLVDLYVPDWVAAQEEFLAVERMSGPNVAGLRDAARARMLQAGMSEAQIERVATTRTAQPRVTLTAPLAGTVSELMVREGATAMPGMALLRLQGTRTVWAEGQVPESQAALLQPGARVSATSPAVPGQTFDGRLQALLPAIDPATRTLKARLELSNPGGRLVPGMLVQMRFAQASRPKALLVPSEAVIHTGSRTVVMLAEDDGRFRPVDVATGLESGGRTEIVKGLAGGQRVVTSGQFLIDSEASLRGVETRLDREPPTSGGTPAAPASSGATHSTAARVDSIEADTVTLTHPPIPALKWPEMTMEFKLPPPEQRPRDLAPGQDLRIEFRLQEGGVPQITRIERPGNDRSRR